MGASTCRNNGMRSQNRSKTTLKENVEITLSYGSLEMCSIIKTGISKTWSNSWDKEKGVCLTMLQKRTVGFI